MLCCILMFRSRDQSSIRWINMWAELMFFMFLWFLWVCWALGIYLFCTGLFQYSGWSANNKEMYYPAPIVFKMQNRKETIVEFLKDAIKEWVCMYLCTIFYHYTVPSYIFCLWNKQQNYLNNLSCELDPSLVFLCGSILYSCTWQWFLFVFHTVKGIWSQGWMFMTLTCLPTVTVWKVSVSSLFLMMFVTVSPVIMCVYI